MPLVAAYRPAVSLPRPSRRAVIGSAVLGAVGITMGAAADPYVFAADAEDGVCIHVEPLNQV